jgi:biotin transport system substrate-specific component
VTRRLPARDLALVAVFAALIAVLGLPGAVAPFGLAVPITAQTLGVMLAGLLLGPRRGALAVLAFLALVAAGLPLLAGGRGGLGVFAGPSAGYLLGWVAGAFVAGLLADLLADLLAGLRDGRLRLVSLLVAAVVGGVAVVYAVGVPVLAWRAQLPFTKALAANWAFLPGDLAKAVVAAVVARGVERGYPLRERRPAAAVR